VKSSAKVFLSSGGFGIVVAAIYWSVSRETAGTVLLGMLGLALLFAASYTLLAAVHHAPFPGDEPDEGPEDVAGEAVAPIATKSIWPVVFACGVLAGLGGMLYGAWLLVPGVLILIISGVGLMRETAAAPGGRS
jgi:Cytochrome c oxidase subunit IV